MDIRAYRFAETYYKRMVRNDCIEKTMW